jgi:hypothetical protein
MWTDGQLYKDGINARPAVPTARRVPVTLAGLEPATSPAPENNDALSPLSYSVVTIFITVCGGARASGFPAALDYLLFFDFDCARGGRPAVLASIGHIAELRIL